jgi:hypothetical protein
MEDELKDLKERLTANPEALAKELAELPYELVEVLAGDPEFGPVMETALSKESASQPGQAGKLSAAAFAAKIRREQEEAQHKEEERKLSLLTRIQRLDVGAKAKLARNGDASARAILVKDANKLVSMAVLANPKLTIQEIEVLAASRNVSDEILREISRNQDWCKSYTVILALTNNPKTPVAISLAYLPKLLTRDIRFLAKSKGIPEPVRVTAKRLASRRNS